MKKTIVLLSFCLVSLATQAQSNTKIEKINQLLDLSGSTKMSLQVMNQMMASFQKSLPNVPEDFWEGCKKEMKADDIIKLIIPIYDKYYTESDIDQLIVFYNSPIGKKMITVLPQITQESMDSGQKWGKEIGEKVLGQLKEKGYLEK